MKEEILFPMTCNVLVPGHIKALEKLSKMGFVTVGLLTPEAMKGYKAELMPYKDREYILETVAYAIGNIDVVPQKSLDPSDLIKRFKITALASGDGFEECELRAIKKFKLKRIDLNSGHKLHASELIKKPWTKKKK